MSTEALIPETLRGGETPARRFDPKSATPFVNKSVSEETRRAYLAVSALPAGSEGSSGGDTNFVEAGLRGTAPAAFRYSKKERTTDSLKATVAALFFCERSRSLQSRMSLGTTSEGCFMPANWKNSETARREVRYLLSGPDRSKPEGARDYALMLVMLRLSLRVSEVCSLRVSSVKWSHGRWTMRCKVKGGREEVWPLPKDVKEAIDHYIKLDRRRREIAHSGGEEAYLFQPSVNYRTLDFDRPLSTRMVQKIVKGWADYSRLGDLSPHDLRRTAITRALDSGLTYRQVQMMSKHKDPKTVMRYDYGRENLDQNAANFFGYDEE